MTDGKLAREVRRIAGKIGSLEQQVRSIARASQASYRSLEDGPMVAYDTDGVVRTVIGLQADGTYTIADKNAPPPPAPSTPIVSAREGVLVVTWDGGTQSGEPWPADFHRVEVHQATSPGVPTTDDTEVASFHSPRGGTLTLALPHEIDFFYRLVAVNTSGVESAPSVESDAARPLPPASAGPSGPDGEVPASSPAVVVAPLGVGGVVAAWDPVENADPVTYEVYVSPAPITVFDATTLLGEGPETSLAIGLFPDGTATVPGQPVYVRVWAKDADGRALEPGAEGTATPRQADTAYISAGYVYGGRVESTQVQTGNLNAALALLGSLTVGNTAGRHLVLDPSGGLQVIAEDGTILVHFPTTAGSPNVFRGDIVAEGLTTLGRASFRGVDNEISRNSAFVLASGTTRPSNAPSIGAFTETLADIPELMTAAGWLCQSGNLLHRIVNRSAGGFGSADRRLLTWDMTTGAAGAVTESATLPGALGTDYFAPPSGLTKIGSTFYALLWKGGSAAASPAYSDQGWYVHRFDAAGAAVGVPWRYQSLNLNYASGVSYSASDDEAPCPASDGATLAIAQKNKTTGTVRLQTFNTAGGAALTTKTTAATYAGAVKLGRVQYGTFDRSGPRWLMHLAEQYEGWVHAFDTDLVDLTAERADLSGGFHYDATQGRWYGVPFAYGSNPVGSRIKFSKNKDLTPVWGGYSWYDSDPTGTGTHETTLSPLTKYVPTKLYHGVSVYVNVAPADAGDPDSPDSRRWYLHRGEAQPAESDMHLTAMQPGTYNEGVLDPDFLGQAPPAGNTFPDGNAGELRTGIGGFLLKGDGTGAWPYLSGQLEAYADGAAVREADAAEAAAEANANTYTDQEIAALGKWETGDMVESARSSKVGWHLCHGAFVPQSGDPDLFAQIGHKFSGGVEVQAGYFKLPDMRERVAVGANAAKPLGSSGGASTVTLTDKNLPPHPHDMTHDHDMGHDHAHRTNTTDGAATASMKSGATTGGTDYSGPLGVQAFAGSTGGSSKSATGNGPGTSDPVNIENKYVAVNVFIKR